MAGIQETKDVLAFVFSLGKATASALEDGDIGWSDAMDFIEPLKKLGPAIDNIEDVLVELQDLDDAEFAELVQYAKDEFGLADLAEDTEVMVEEAINAGVEIVKIVRMFS
jgi:hypothetical protein|tara:strand:+ start:106 stop:435 length:330 start_codon:yes stop_codon:yes gene_type:complete